MTSVIVVGSINLDIVTACPSFPRPGETVTGSSARYAQGGKGANQARAAALAGADVTFIGAVGDDGAARTVLPPLSEAEVELRVTTVEGPTGVAVVTVDDTGENTIVVVPGANAAVALTADDRRAIAAADVLLMQFEIPPDVVLDAARTANAHGTVVLLNPSPVRAQPDELWGLVDAAIVNEAEGRSLADHLGSVDVVVTTRGGRGASLRGRDGVVTVPGIPVDVVDTTGAGDAFTGALAAAWDLPESERLRLANEAGSRATTVRGACAPQQPN
ncbi:ribokinase [Gordonia neofelifaecis]|uniref:Ribokinase n=1 Tax=Gordonia neofelifaecis NRRL B-59395 TaxID=644548 RepID=F1YFP7_9ACTN|nr:ribokinase [Gordonia neofelifaecis]EGD56679.1 PfkB domain protein [Gordonia neofelifaecis NRRL B-59395]